MEEIWKFWKETNSNRYGKRVYEVSNFGCVKCNGKLYICTIGKDGYYYLGKKLLHRIVAELFIPNPENKPFVDHIDTNRLNNRVDNLRWVTRTENNNNPLTKKHNSEANKSKKLSEETKRKMSEIIKHQYKNGRIPTNLGKHLSEETKKKISGISANRQRDEKGRFI